MRGIMSFSAALHVTLFLVASNVWWMGAHKLRPVGSREGSRIVMLYEPHPVAQARPMPRKLPIRITRTIPARITAPATVPDLAQATAPHPDKALGDGQVNITYLQGFPAQQPDMAEIGPVGDIDLDVQIDEAGRIAQVHMRRGMTESINRMIVATVEQWVFQPAVRNGRPISISEQLHFHYDRRSANCGWECFSLEVQ